VVAQLNGLLGVPSLREGNFILHHQHITPTTGQSQPFPYAMLLQD
jgi:hypothetical protein